MITHVISVDITEDNVKECEILQRIDVFIIIPPYSLRNPSASLSLTTFTYGNNSCKYE